MEVEFETSWKSGFQPVAELNDFWLPIVLNKTFDIIQLLLKVVIVGSVDRHQIALPPQR